MVKNIVIIGLGVTGLSCARYLARRHLKFIIVDTREQPPCLDILKKELPHIKFFLGPLSSNLLLAASEIIVSPGISLQEPVLQQALSCGISIIGDIELFCREVASPIVAITGSNGKSTVTTLMGIIAKNAGIRVAVGGNIGIPVLDLLEEKHAAELYILELSSFQLETTYSLKNHIALILNISPDHMDRYENMQAYSMAKQRIYQQSHIDIYNGDDLLTKPKHQASQASYYFTANTPTNDFSCFAITTKKNGTQWLAQGRNLLMPVSELPIQAIYYQMNMLAVFAIAYALDINTAYVRQSICDFKGLPHRCQQVMEYQGVTWFNDSKATNISAAVASIKGLGLQYREKGKLILLAGGQGKGADFSELGICISQHVDTLIIYGEDGHRIQSAVANTEIKVVDATGFLFVDIIALAYDIAQPNDCVLLAPACASFDMFKNFEARGEEFIRHVNEITCL